MRLGVYWTGMTATHHADLHDRLRRFERRLPRFGARSPQWLRGASSWIRAPLAVLLIVGGCFGFLPVLGFWMIPLGLVLLALDVPFLSRPVVRTSNRIEAWWTGRPSGRP
jgi:hypothetical protein